MAVLKEAELGAPVAERIRQVGISERHVSRLNHSFAAHVSRLVRTRRDRNQGFYAAHQQRTALTYCFSCSFWSFLRV